MNLDKVISRFMTAPCERAELRRLARALGRELPREQLDDLRALRAALMRGPLRECLAGEDVDPPSYAAGYVEGLLDLTAEYESQVQENIDARAVEDMVARKGGRDVLLLLRDGAKLPSELAAVLGEDRSRITRILQKLRAAGLVQAYAGESSDGRVRPHRLTARGRRVAAELEPGLSPEAARGIRLAVGLFRHLLSQGSTSSSALAAIAGEVLDDHGAAAEAVSVWADEAQRVGLISEYQGDFKQSGDPRASRGCCDGGNAGDGSGTGRLDSVPQLVLAEGSEAIRRSNALWQTAPAVINELKKQGREHMPVYVRTSDESWSAWIHALGALDAPGHTIVDGDLAALQPPEQGFVLVYDDPAALRADRAQPAMRAFMDRAAGKFVVASPEDDVGDVPEDFVALTVKG